MACGAMRGSAGRSRGAHVAHAAASLSRACFPCDKCGARTHSDLGATDTTRDAPVLRSTFQRRTRRRRNQPESRQRRCAEPWRRGAARPRPRSCSRLRRCSLASSAGPAPVRRGHRSSEARRPFVITSTADTADTADMDTARTADTADMDTASAPPPCTALAQLRSSVTCTRPRRRP